MLFAPLASREFGERVAAALGTALSPMEEREFEGGEHKTRPLVSVRGAAGLRAAVAERRRGGQRQRPSLSPAVLHRRSQGQRRRERHGLHPVPGLRAQGPPHQGARPGHAALRGAAHRGRRHGPPDRARRAQSRGLRDARSAARSITSRPHRCSPTTWRPGRATRASASSRRTSAARSGRSASGRYSSRARVARSASPSSRSVAAAAWSAAASRSSGRSPGSRAVIVDDLISAGTTLMRGVKACRAAGAAQVDAFATHGVFEPESTQLLGPDGPTGSSSPTRSCRRASAAMTQRARPSCCLSRSSLPRRSGASARANRSSRCGRCSRSVASGQRALRGGVERDRQVLRGSSPPLLRRAAVRLVRAPRVELRACRRRWLR